MRRARASAPASRGSTSRRPARARRRARPPSSPRRSSDSSRPNCSSWTAPSRRACVVRFRSALARPGTSTGPRARARSRSTWARRTCAPSARTKRRSRPARPARCSVRRRDAAGRARRTSRRLTSSGRARTSRSTPRRAATSRSRGPSQAKRQPTLLSLLDTSVTAPGSRLLREWCRTRCATRRPHRRATTPSPRSSPTSAGASGLREALSRRRGRRADRLAHRARPGAPARGLGAGADAVRAAGAAASLADTPPALLRDAAAALASTIAGALIARAIASEPASQVRDGGVIADGYDGELDELRAIDRDCGVFLADLERRERERTGIRTSRSSTTASTGSTSRSRMRTSQRIPTDYRRRQTLKNAERYVTPELKAFEDKALSAQERALAREKLLFEALVSSLARRRPRCNAPPPRSRRSTYSPPWRTARRVRVGAPAGFPASAD